MNKIVQAMVAVRDRFANEFNEILAAANGSIPESDQRTAAANMARLDDGIERATKFVERCERVMNDRYKNKDELWGSLIQYGSLKVEELVGLALRGDRRAHRYASSQAALLLWKKGKPLPRPLRFYVAHLLVKESTESSRGKGRPTEWAKNALIVILLNTLKTVAYLQLAAVPRTTSRSVAATS